MRSKDIYDYSLKGQVIKETKVIDGVTYMTQYTYDMNGNIKTMTYPSGRVTCDEGVSRRLYLPCDELWKCKSIIVSQGQKVERKKTAIEW